MFIADWILALGLSLNLLFRFLQTFGFCKYGSKHLRMKKTITKIQYKQIKGTNYIRPDFFFFLMAPP